MPTQLTQLRPEMNTEYYQLYALCLLQVYQFVGLGPSNPHDCGEERHMSRIQRKNPQHAVHIQVPNKISEGKCDHETRLQGCYSPPGCTNHNIASKLGSRGISLGLIHRGPKTRRWDVFALLAPAIGQGRSEIPPIWLVRA